MPLPDAQAFLRERGLDGWLVFDFQGANPTLARIVPGERHVTRRVFLWIPAAGAPVLLVGAVDAGGFRDAAFEVRTYTHHASLLDGLRALLAGARVVAMEYAPGGALPYASRVDGGTLDLVRDLGVTVVPSADVYQHAYARLTAAEQGSHREAAALLDRAKDDAFAHLFAEAMAGKAITERDVQERLVRFFAEHGLVADHPPIVGVNAHAGDPHYAPAATGSAQIRRGDWVLIDLWAKRAAPGAVYADITWVGNVGRDVPARRREVFDAVRDARDAGVAAIADAAAGGARATGAAVDAAVRGHLRARGLADWFTHRTGHSVGTEVHGSGANLDGFETVDTRELLPGLLVTIEPGVYLPWGEPFGVRSEIDVLIGPDGRPEVTTRAQRDVLVP